MCSQWKKFLSKNTLHAINERFFMDGVFFGKFVPPRSEYVVMHVFDYSGMLFWDRQNLFKLLIRIPFVDYFYVKDDCWEEGVTITLLNTVNRIILELRCSGSTVHTGAPLSVVVTRQIIHKCRRHVLLAWNDIHCELNIIRLLCERPIWTGFHITRLMWLIFLIDGLKRMGFFIHG